MALETLKGVEEIGGFKVVAVNDPQELSVLIDSFIHIDHSDNAIYFKIQNGPIKEHGVNGCQVDTLIEAAKVMLEGIDKKFPCFENKMALAGLAGALGWLEHRKSNREQRGVEGTSQA